MTGEDTLPQWLQQRFRYVNVPDDWEALGEVERLYWQHEADAVRRAVARNGFKDSRSVVGDLP